MLTVKHVTPDGESVREAIEVRCVNEPCSPTQSNTIGYRQMVYADLPNGVTGSYDKGTIYVMNGEGATVSKWDLGGWPTP